MNMGFAFVGSISMLHLEQPIVGGHDKPHENLGDLNKNLAVVSVICCLVGSREKNSITCCNVLW